MRREDLVQKFRGLLENYSKESVSEDNVRILFKELLVRVLNTMANSFFTCQDVLEQVRENKGVYAQASLRDKLKVYTGEMHVQLTF